MRAYAIGGLTAALSLSLILPAFASKVEVPVGQKVEMQLVKSLSSGTATVGETFRAEAAEAIVVGGQTVISKGAEGRGTVVAATKAQGKSAGTLTIKFTEVRATDGEWIILSDSKAQSEGNAEKGKASTATIASTVVLGPLGLFAHNMVKGKDVTLDTKQSYPAWVKETISVNAP